VNANPAMVARITRPRRSAGRARAEGYFGRALSLYDAVNLRSTRPEACGLLDQSERRLACIFSAG